MKKYIINDVEFKVEFFNQYLRDLIEQYCASSYDDFLDDTYGTFNIGYSKFYASDILKTCDGIAYDCGLDDYVEFTMDDAQYDLERDGKTIINGVTFTIKDDE